MNSYPQRKSTLLSLCTRREIAVVYVIFLIVLFRVRTSLWWIPTWDTRVAFLPWLSYINTHGHWLALKDTFSDYFPSYLYLLTAASYFPRLTPLGQVKVIPLIFDFTAAFMAYRILVLLEHARGRTSPLTVRAIAAPLVLLALPSFLLNGALWGQCDSIYITFLLASIYYLMLEKPTHAAIAYGLALCFKLQAIFLGPVLLVVLLRRRFRWWHAILVPLAWIASIVPILITGRTFTSVFNIAGVQSTEIPSLATNVANPWQWFYLTQRSDRAGMILGLLLTVIAAACLTYVGYTRQKLSKHWLFFFATVSLLVFPYVMPKMHDRYFLPGQVFLVILACYDERFILPAALFESALLLPYCLYFHTTSNNLTYAAAILASTAGLLIMLRELLRTRTHIQVSQQWDLLPGFRRGLDRIRRRGTE